MRANRLAGWAPGTAEKWQLAFAQLLEAAFYAQDLQKPVWGFAVEIESLRLAGLTTNDLYWLSSKGYIAQATGTTARNSRHRRRFCVDRSPPSSRQRRIVLTQAGLAFALRHCRPSPRRQKRRSISEVSAVSSAEVPHWEDSTRMLWLGSNLIKQFKVPARNQELVLSAFEEEGWPNSIDDPLPPSTGIQSRQRLHDTIIRLNRSHKDPLIRFHGSGNGLAIHWERVSAAATDTRPAPKRL
jgi:hypothetical protein